MLDTVSKVAKYVGVLLQYRIKMFRVIFLTMWQSFMEMRRLFPRCGWLFFGDEAALLGDEVTFS